MVKVDEINPKTRVGGWKRPEASTYHVWPERCISLNPSCFWQKRLFSSTGFHRVEVPSELSDLVFHHLPFAFKSDAWEESGSFLWVYNCLNYKPQVEVVAVLPCSDIYWPPSYLCPDMKLGPRRWKQSVLWKGHLFCKQRQLCSCLQTIHHFQVISFLRSSFLHQILLFSFSF